MLIEKIIEQAQLNLKNVKVKDAVIGISLMGVQLDNGHVGVSYTIREDLPNGCSIFPYAQEMIGKPAGEMTEWLVNGKEDLQRGIGMAVITAASQSIPLVDLDNPGLTFGINVLPTDIVGMIGYIRPVAKEFANKAKKVKIFDMGLSLRGGEGVNLYPTEKQSEELVDCDIVTLSGTTIINKTIDELLSICKNAREIVMIGPSTPMLPKAFKDTNITVLAGSWWNNDKKDEIFKKISLACGVSHLSKYMIKKCVASK